MNKLFLFLALFPIQMHSSPAPELLALEHFTDPYKLYAFSCEYAREVETHVTRNPFTLSWTATCTRTME